MKVENKAVEQSISKEDFRGLCLAIIPMIEEVRKFMADHKIGELASLTMAADGYIDFSVHESDWRLSRLNGDKGAQMCNRCVEVFKF